MIAVATRRNVTILQGSTDQTHRRQRGLILRLQRIFHC